MSRIDKFTAKLGGNIRESMGAGSASAGGPLPSPVAGPSQYQGITRPKEALTIPLDRIIPDPDQPRKEFDEGPLGDLAASLKARGQLQPIRVRWSAESDRWVIIAGERRYRAAVKAGLASLLCVEVKGTMTSEEILEEQLVENCIREDLKPIEQAKAFRALVEAKGCSYRQLAEILNISHMAVSRAMTLLELPQVVQDHVSSGEMAASVAVEVAKLADPVAQEEIAHRVVAEKLSRAETVEAVRKAAAPKPARAGGAKGRSAAKQKDPAERSLRTTGGVKIVASYKKGLSVEAWVEALREAARMAEAKLEPQDQAAA